MDGDHRVWRAGRSYPIHVYAVSPDGDAHIDAPVCTAHTVQFAKWIVRDHNRMLALAEETGVPYEE